MHGWSSTSAPCQDADAAASSGAEIGRRSLLLNWMLLCCYGFLMLVTSFETIYYLYVTIYIYMLLICYIESNLLLLYGFYVPFMHFFWTLSKGIWMEKPHIFTMEPFPLFSLNHHLNAATAQDRSPSVKLSCSIRCRVGSSKTSIFLESNSLKIGRHLWALRLSSVLSDYGVNILPIWRSQTIHIYGSGISLISLIIMHCLDW